MVAGHFSNFYFDLGETLGMKFIRACSNNIGELKEFTNASQSYFLFYLVSCVQRRDRALRPAGSSRASLSRAACCDLCAAEWREDGDHRRVEHPRHP